MRVRYLTSFGRPRGAGIVNGDEADVSKEQAERLFAKGFAEPVKGKTSETATKRPAETADNPPSPAPKRHPQRRKPAKKGS